MDLQGFFNTDAPPKEETLEQKFERERQEWSEKIAEMSAKLKNVMEIPNLMTYVYTERQRCVEYHRYLISLMITLNKEYRKQYNERYDYWTYKSQTRFPNEDTKKTRILSDIAGVVTKRETLENHSKFILDTCATIDHIIWAIPRRVEIEQISRGK